MLQIGAISLSGRIFRTFVMPVRGEDIWSEMYARGAQLGSSRRIASNIGWDPSVCCSEYSTLCQFNQYLKSVGCTTLCAHNGRSFDDIILRSAYDRCSIEMYSVNFMDSLRDMFRPLWKFRCNKLGVLHNHFFPDVSVRWHTALADARALRRLWRRACFDYARAHPSRVPVRASEDMCDSDWELLSSVCCDHARTRRLLPAQVRRSHSVRSGRCLSPVLEGKTSEEESVFHRIASRLGQCRI